MESKTVTIFKYICLKCGKTREARSEERAKNQICRKCEALKPIEGQMDLLSA